MHVYSKFFCNICGKHDDIVLENDSSDREHFRITEWSLTRIQKHIRRHENELTATQQTLAALGAECPTGWQVAYRDLLETTNALSDALTRRVGSWVTDCEHRPICSTEDECTDLSIRDGQVT